MSQEELAHLAGVDRTFVSRAERGVSQPALATVLLLAQALKVSAASLVAMMERNLTQPGAWNRQRQPHLHSACTSPGRYMRMQTS